MTQGTNSTLYGNCGIFRICRNQSLVACREQVRRIGKAHHEAGPVTGRADQPGVTAFPAAAEGHDALRTYA